MNKYIIDPTKIKPGMVIHTPTLEQSIAVCKTTNISYFRYYKENTCINIRNNGNWSYGSKSFYKSEGYTITPFEDILVQKSIPMYLNRKPQVGDYVHRKEEHLRVSFDIKTFKLKDALIPYKIIKLYKNHLEFDGIGPWDIDKFNVINPNHPSHPEYSLQNVSTNNDKPASVAPSANPTPTLKEPEMNNTTLKLLLTLMGVTTETIKDATNSNYIGIITDQDNTYVGYVYADTIKQLKEIIAKSENEGNTIHCFKFQDSFKQATRPVVKVTRTTTEVVEEV